MWPAAIQNHLNAGLPMAHQWAIEVQAKAYSDNSLVYKGLWTGDYDLSLSVDGRMRSYEGAMGGLRVGPIRYRIGTVIMTQEIEIALSQEGQEVVRGYNTRNAPAELYCFCYDAATGAFLGSRRFFKGFVDGTNIVTDQQGGTDTMPMRLVSFARRGTMTTTGKKSNESQKQRNPADDFRKYSDLGNVAADPWGAEDDS